MTFRRFDDKLIEVPTICNNETAMPFRFVGAAMKPLLHLSAALLVCSCGASMPPVGSGQVSSTGAHPFVIRSAIAWHSGDATHVRLSDNRGETCRASAGQLESYRETLSMPLRSTCLRCVLSSVWHPAGL